MVVKGLLTGIVSRCAIMLALFSCFDCASARTPTPGRELTWKPLEWRCGVVDAGNESGTKVKCGN